MRAEARISLGITLVTAFALASALVLIHFALNRFQERRFDGALLEAAREAARQTGHHLAPSADPLGPAEENHVFIDKYVVVYAASGVVLASTHSRDRVPPLERLSSRLAEPFDFLLGQKALRGVRLPLENPVGATLLVAATRDDLDGDDQFLDYAMLLAFVASMVSLFVCSLLLTKRFTVEHRRIAATLHSVAGGDLYARVLQGSKDPDLEQWRLDLNEVAEKLSTLIRQQRRFIANAAHELRSPITALYGELQQSLRQERSSAEYKTSIGYALRATKRLNHLADDLLTLARAEHAPSSLEAVSLSELWAEAQHELAGLAREKGVRFEAELRGQSVRGRASDLQRLLRNLLDNALRHSPPGGTVTCAATVHGEWVTLRVSDEGPGIDPTDHARVFEPFFRSLNTASSPSEGAGLGLSIAREIARSHGGDIRVEASARGAALLVTLRAAATASTSPPPEGQTDAALSPAP